MLPKQHKGLLTFTEIKKHLIRQIIFLCSTNYNTTDDIVEYDWYLLSVMLLEISP